MCIRDRLEAVEILCWGSLLNIPWTEGISDEEVPTSVDENRSALERRRNILGHSSRDSVCCTTLLEDVTASE